MSNNDLNTSKYLSNITIFSKAESNSKDKEIKSKISESTSVSKDDYNTTRDYLNKDFEKEKKVDTNTNKFGEFEEMIIDSKNWKNNNKSADNFKSAFKLV